MATWVPAPDQNPDEQTAEQPAPAGEPPSAPATTPITRASSGGTEFDRRRRWQEVAKTSSVAITIIAGIATVVQLFISIKTSEPDADARGAASSPWYAFKDASESKPQIANGGARSSGISGLMDGTFAGQNACNPEHERPFIVEWDATDMSSFESLAAQDVVMVAYDGCELTIIDTCRDDSLPGSFGSYRPPVWTSGSLETIDIHDETELRAKLPLGRASLGDRVAAGEQFHMEYFVSGTVYATRSEMYREDLARRPGCAAATHFVYSYNLGAFALGSSTGLDSEAGVSVFGLEAESQRSSGRKAEKRGGELSACKSDDSDAGRGCKTPIRLNLRPIASTANPTNAAMTAPDSDAALNAAGQINAQIDASVRAQQHFQSAQKKLAAEDGAGCLAELDAQDQLNSTQQSTDPASYAAAVRFQCLMLAGKCNAGKQLGRQYYEKLMANNPLALDLTIDQQVMEFCRGDEMTARDELMQAQYRIQKASLSPHSDPQLCIRELQRLKKNIDQVQPRGDDDLFVINAKSSMLTVVPRCFTQAGDCEQAWSVYGEADGVSNNEQTARAMFESFNPECASR